MTEVTCPTCESPAVIGLPRDATVEAVEATDTGDIPVTDGAKTRVVRCHEDHAVTVTFTVTAPDRSSSPL